MVGLLKSKYLRLFFCLLLCFCLCFSLFCVPAKAVVTEGLLLGALLAALTAGNITISANNIANATFVTEFERWIDTSGLLFADLASDAISFNANKQIVFKSAAWSLIDDFISWIQDDLFDGSSFGSFDVLSPISFSGLSVGELDSSGNLITAGSVVHIVSNMDVSYLETTVLGDSQGWRVRDYSIRAVLNGSLAGEFAVRSGQSYMLCLQNIGGTDYIGWHRVDTQSTGLYSQNRLLASYYSFLSSDTSFSVSSDGIVDWSDIVIPDEDVVLDVSGFDFSDEESFISGVVPAVLDGSLTASIGDDVVDPPSDTDQDYSGILGQIGGFLSDIRSNTDGLLSNATSFFESILEDTFGFLSDLPDYLRGFAGRFVGIWHYVVSWVGSLGAWFGVLFSVWRGLPYAMVVPVYASAVVVLVIGMWKRFFG